VADRLDVFDGRGEDGDNEDEDDDFNFAVKRDQGAYFPKEVKQVLFILLMTFGELDTNFMESGKMIKRSTKCHVLIYLNTTP
jgi:hypothetical protein